MAERNSRPKLLRANTVEVKDEPKLEGRVWVPPLSERELAEQNQYWNKFKVAKSDFLFQEVVERFQKKAVNKQSVKHAIPVAARSKSEQRGRNRNKIFVAPFG